MTLNENRALVTKSTKVNENGNIGKTPEFYTLYEYQDLVLPGSAYLDIAISKKSAFLGSNEYIGSTIIDLEERLFMPEWTAYSKKPVEKRNIAHPARGSRGRLEMWIDIMKPMEIGPATVIFPKVQIPHELRVIVWETEDCVFKDTTTECNDLYARGCVRRGEQWMETDTHWFCRAKGSFNWRWKWEIQLPVDQNKNYGEDQFTIQLWDRDLIGSDEMIGYVDISLHKHRMLSKAFVRSKPVDMRMKIKGKGEITKKMWFDVYNSEVVDDNGNKISQGRIQMSFQAVPLNQVDKFANGIGREEPNFHPALPDPVGRFVFDILSPLKMIKTIVGPKLYYRICFAIFCSIFIAILIAVGYYVLPNVLGNKLSSII